MKQYKLPCSCRYALHYFSGRPSGDFHYGRSIGITQRADGDLLRVEGVLTVSLHPVALQRGRWLFCNQRPHIAQFRVLTRDKLIMQPPSNC